MGCTCSNELHNGISSAQHSGERLSEGEETRRTVRPKAVHPFRSTYSEIVFAKIFLDGEKDRTTVKMVLCSVTMRSRSGQRPGRSKGTKNDKK